MPTFRARPLKNKDLRALLSRNCGSWANSFTASSFTADEHGSTADVYRQLVYRRAVGDGRVGTQISAASANLGLHCCDRRRSSESWLALLRWALHEQILACIAAIGAARANRGLPCCDRRRTSESWFEFQRLAPHEQIVACGPAVAFGSAVNDEPLVDRRRASIDRRRLPPTRLPPSSSQWVRQFFSLDRESTLAYPCLLYT
ncbi:MAG: hypothetical protein RLY70_1463, partial [Planctomycetota bacterium]